MSAAPRVTVIVPVRNRRALLRKLLDALDAQTLRDFEVLVVDDGSTDGTPDEAVGPQVRLVANEGRGAYAGRRTGVAASTAPFLAFTDSDCVPSPKWLELGVRALEDGAAVVNGLTRPERTPAPLERTMGSGEEGLYPTCNVFYRRDAYERAGGFDDGAARRFGFRPDGVPAAMGFGEDALLAWNVQRQGGRAAYVPDAVVEHAVMPPDPVDTFRRTWMVVAFPALLREIPEIRRPPLVRGGVQLGARTRAPLYVAVAALAARRPRPAAVAAGVWIALRARDVRALPGSRAQHVRGLAAELGVDVVTAAALLAGTVRHRSLVL